MKVLALLTCYNRREKTVKAISGLKEGNPAVELQFLAVDAGSTDGTGEALRAIPGVTVISGHNGLYYSNGMRLAMEQAKKQEGYDYCLLMNDDVEFFEKAVEKLAKRSAGRFVIVGPTCDKNGGLSYGAIKYDKGIHYHILNLNEAGKKADTFNANCVLIPWEIFRKKEIMDAHYIHSLGDFDYGLMLRAQGCSIYSLNEYAGMCEDNPPDGTWEDPSLPIAARIRDKESVKGVPFGQWFYFLKKNFGLSRAVVSSVTPYIRILLHR